IMTNPGVLTVLSETTVLRTAMNFSTFVRWSLIAMPRQRAGAARLATYTANGSGVVTGLAVDG
ncbi:MAG: hypothetical protein WB116_09830, partial [Candidatus Dormiibacterota bacterium]